MRGVAKGPTHEGFRVLCSHFFAGFSVLDPRAGRRNVVQMDHVDHREAVARVASHECLPSGQALGVRLEFGENLAVVRDLFLIEGSAE